MICSYAKIHFQVTKSFVNNQNLWCLKSFVIISTILLSIHTLHVRGGGKFHLTLSTSSCSLTTIFKILLTDMQEDAVAAINNYLDQSHQNDLGLQREIVDNQGHNPCGSHEFKVKDAKGNSYSISVKDDGNGDCSSFFHSC